MKMTMLLLLLSIGNLALLHAQPPSNLQNVISVNGKVVDERSQPLARVSVSVKGTNINTATDSSGNFSINVSNKSATLLFRFIGYNDVDLPAVQTGPLLVQLTVATKSMNEIVVIGYGQQSRALVTSAVTKVDSRSIGVQPVATPGEALAGLAPGVQVQSDQGAKPGAPPTIRVRGVSSLSTSNDPLYVVDGYPLQTSSGFNLLNPNDIESLEVLKDAAAAAIYGSRAANGVVLVTTKRGRAGRTIFSVSSYIGSQKVNRFYNVLKRDQFVTLVKDISRIRNLAYPTSLDGDISALPDVDWQRQVFRTATISNVELNASGGSEKVRFSASFGRFKQEGVVVGTEYSRYTSRVSLDADIVKNVRFGFSVSPSYSEEFRQPASGQASGAGANAADLLTGVPGLIANYSLPSPLNQALTFQPIVPVYRPNGDYAQPYDRDLGFNLSPTAVFFATNFFNPVGILKQSINRARAFRTLSNVFLEYTPVKNLKLKTFVGAFLETEKVHGYIPGTMAASQAPTASFSNPSLAGIYASDNVRNSFDWVVENTATYDRVFGEHHFNLLGLFSAQKYNSQINYTAGVPGTFITTAVQSPLASPNTVGTELFDDNTFVSYAGRLTYDFAKKYLFTAAIRQDESSRFGPNNRKAVFPSFSVGWRLAEEVFLKSALNAAKISELKLRGGYGRTGNANIGSFTYVNAITLNRNYAAGNIRLFGSQQAGFANPDLTWEKNDQISVGADVGLFGNKLLLTADYFFRTSKGMLLNKALPAIVGYATSYQANLGTLENRGVEFSATTSVNLNQLRWTINANASTYKTKVTDLGGPAALPGVAAINGWNNVYQVKVGQPLGQMYGYTVVGVFKNAGDLAANPQTVSGNKVGDWMIKDQNGDGRIDVNDVTVIGHGLPDFIYGLTNTFQYKNFDLNVLVQGVQGVNIINGNYRQLITGNNNQNTLDIYYNNYFDPVNPNRNVDYPIPASGSSINPTNSLVNKDVENGSYFRVRNITFGYRFSSALLQRAKLTSARLYVTAQNPVLITKYRGYNPEANINTSNPVTPGVDQGTYPVATTYIVGINFGF